MVQYISIRTDDSKSVKDIKSRLEDINALNRQVKIRRDGQGFFIPTILKEPAEWFGEFTLEHYEFMAEESVLEGVVRAHLQSSGATASKILSLMNKVPKKWSLYPPLILFSGDAFTSPEWEKYATEGLYTRLLEHHPGFTHIALNRPIIKTDMMRRPLNITPLYGDFGPDPTQKRYDMPTQQDYDAGFWCGVNQNGIDQNWAPLYTMFSRGNVKEKARVLRSFACKDTVVFDLYCGIGYFSLSYLKNGCKNIFCWELNGWSIEGFKRSLRSKHRYQVFTPDDDFNYDIYMQLKERVQVFIFHESNECATTRLATFPDASLDVSHVNLGLLPSSQGSWGVTSGIVNKSTRSVEVHVHENIHISEFEVFCAKVAEHFGPVRWLERVKTFAPDVWHVVVDATAQPLPRATIS